jgi:predicted ATPase/class 3 adenylate cyclase/GAF domain-containing protein
MIEKKAIGTKDIIPGYEIVENIRISYPHTIYRALAKTDGKEVIIKTLTDEYPKKEDLAGIEREYRIIKALELGQVIKVYDLVPHGNGNLAMVMECFGVSLDRYLTNFELGILPLDEFFELAIGIVDIGQKIHDKKIVHKNLQPSNILVSTKPFDLRLIDFNSSSELTREHIDYGSIFKWNEQSLPYISPEQTGRINRDIDYRSDLYSLGVCFFQLLTGQLPFHAREPLEWVHAIISREPPLASKINPGIPRALAEIISKLLSKNAEDRYQSSYGLSVDLKKSRELWKQGQTDFHFPIAASDMARQFHIPQKLFGREAEIRTLENCFQNASHGAVEFCLVSGYSGVGKTSLVHELGKPIVQKNGYLIQGKFEQFRQNAPYAALASAFQDLIKQILGESKKKLDGWNEKITTALGANAQLLVDMIPELSLIIGKQQPVPDLSPAETLNRFALLFVNFVKVFCSEEHPLVIFLDDLQWSDVPTLNLMNRILSSHELSNLMVIGAYRDKDIDTTHPLALTIREIEAKRHIEHLILQPLSLDATGQLTAETLVCDPSRSSELSQVIFEKAAGNPFFTIELLKNLKDREIIFFNAENGVWDWNISAVKNVNYSDNVIDILVANQNRLKTSTQEILQLAACIGATFDLRTLSAIRKTGMDETNALLLDALKSNMVVPVDDSYKFVSQGNRQGERPGGQEVNPYYRFQHDRIQQAAYSRIDADQKKAYHLEIGRLMLGNKTPGELDEKLMDVVRHFNEGRDLLTDKEERRILARLNLAAGTKAKQSSAYDAALDFLKTGHEALGNNAWQEEYELAWNLNNELQYCFYLTSNWAEADKWTELLLLNSRSDIEKGLLLSARARQYATTGRMKESLEAAYDGLSILGFGFKKDPALEDINEEVKQIQHHLGGRAIADLIDMPVLTDERSKIASQLIMEIFPAAFLSASGTMFPYIVLKSVNISLVAGNSPESAFAYAAYGMLLCGYFDDPALGYEYGKLGVNMIEKFDDIALKARIIYVYAMFIHHWSNHWSTMTPWFRKGIDAGYQSGHLLYLAYSAQDCIIWDPRLDLETASQEHRKLLAIVKECDYQDSLDSGTLFLQMQLNFQGKTKDLYSMTDEEFDENTCVEGMYQRRFMTGISNYHIYKAEIHLLYNDAEGAMVHVLEQEKRMASVIALPQAVRFHLVSFLVRASLWPSLNKTEQEVSMARMLESLGKMTAWAGHCRENFEHLRLLMEAELDHCMGSSTNAVAKYEQAITLARQSGFLRDAAMACELTARALTGLGLTRAAEIYIQDAYHLYYRWGAYRKVDEMEKQYSVLNAGKKNSTLKGRTFGANANSADMLDIGSVLKASQTISGELVLEKLLKETLQILIENAGAQKGAIVEYKDGQLIMQMQTGMEQEDEGPLLPVTLFNTAIRTQAPVVIDNAAELNSFSSDPYIRERKPVSVMCVPLPLHGDSASAVYFENNLTQSAFTKERVEVIKLLASQASISMENARIYEKQEKLLKAQQRFVPQQFLKHLGHNDISKVELGESVSMEMSVLFSDIRNFTPLVEKLSPQAVIELLNHLYSLLAIPITASGGFIDSYAGDGIMALFAVTPIQAIEAAIGMSRKLSEFNVDSGLPPIKLGIGLNTGPLVLGTMGANDRMQCSVLGDTVNLASRIEQLTRVYEAQCLIGENTYNALQDRDAFSVRMVDRVAVKGKRVAVSLFEVLNAEDDDRRKAKEASRTLLADALELYYERRFAEASALFNRGKMADPLDNVFSIFALRSESYTKEPPPEDWQGFEKLMRK